MYTVLSRIYYGWILIGALGVTETISWGILYYAFTVYLAPMETEFGWSRGDMTGAFSIGLLLAGLAAIPAGRWLDRRGPRLLMSVGSIVATCLVLGWSRVGSLPQLYLLWAAIGLTMSATLYDPAFAIANKWFDRRRVQALTAITLMAGFASTIFIPLAGADPKSLACSPMAPTQASLSRADEGPACKACGLARPSATPRFGG